MHSAASHTRLVWGIIWGYMPLPPELTPPNLDIVSVPEPNRIQKGIDLSAAWSAFARTVIAAVPPNPVDAQLALDVLDQVVEQIVDLAGAGAAIATMDDIEGRFRRVSEPRRKKLQEIVDSAVIAPPPPIAPAPPPEGAPPAPGEIPALFPIVEEQEMLSAVFFPIVPLQDELHSNIKKLHGKISGKLLTYRADPQAEIFKNAAKHINLAWTFVDRQRPVSSMSLIQLIDEMSEKNLNPDAHLDLESSSADDRRVSLYNEFNARKATWVGETRAEKLARAESELQNEGTKPSCTRPDLFKVMGRRAIERNELLIYSTCHPEYGSAVRHMLKHLIWVIAQRQHTTMNYENLTLVDGRPKMKDYTEKVFIPQLLGTGGAPPLTFSGMDAALQAASEHHLVGQIYGTLPNAERKKKVQEVVSLTLKLFYMFSLIDVAFGELQVETQTRGHDLTKGGEEITDKDRVLLSRPDSALVHRSQRYDVDSDWSLWWSVLMTHIPAEYGRSNYKDGRQRPGDDVIHMRKHAELEEIKHELIASLDAYFDVDKFTGANGIPPSSLFNPLFPDMMSYLDLAMGERLVIGDQVYGRRGNDVVLLGTIGQVVTAPTFDGALKTEPLPAESNTESREHYMVAEKGWEKFLELTLGAMPSEIKEHEILEHATGFQTGFVDEIIKNAGGLAKLFPGNHMRLALAPIFTLYLGRIFMRYKDTGRGRQATFEHVVHKLRASGADSEGGLGSYKAQLETVIENISDNSHGVRMGRMLEYNVLNRRQKREVFARIAFKKKKKSVPISITPGIRLVINAVPDPVIKGQMEDFLNAVEGKAALPDPSVTRKGDLIRKKDDK